MGKKNKRRQKASAARGLAASSLATQEEVACTKSKQELFSDLHAAITNKQFVEGFEITILLLQILREDGTLVDAFFKPYEEGSISTAQLLIDLLNSDEEDGCQEHVIEILQIILVCVIRISRARGVDCALDDVFDLIHDNEYSSVLIYGVAFQLQKKDGEKIAFCFSEKDRQKLVNNPNPDVQFVIDLFGNKVDAAGLGARHLPHLNRLMDLGLQEISFKYFSHEPGLQKLFIKKSFYVENNYSKMLFIFARYGDPALMQRLVSLYREIFSLTDPETGRNLLAYAARYSSFEMVAVLLNSYLGNKLNELNTFLMTDSAGQNILDAARVNPNPAVLDFIETIYTELVTTRDLVMAADLSESKSDCQPPENILGSASPLMALYEPVDSSSDMEDQIRQKGELLINALQVEGEQRDYLLACCHSYINYSLADLVGKYIAFSPLGARQKFQELGVNFESIVGVLPHQNLFIFIVWYATAEVFVDYLSALAEFPEQRDSWIQVVHPIKESNMLHFAARNKNIGVAGELLPFCTLEMLTQQDSNANLPLHYLAFKGEIQAMKQVAVRLAELREESKEEVARFSDLLNVKNKFGKSALMLAAESSEILSSDFLELVCTDDGLVCFVLNSSIRPSESNLSRIGDCFEILMSQKMEVEAAVTLLEKFRQSVKILIQIINKINNPLLLDKAVKATIAHLLVIGVNFIKRCELYTTQNVVRYINETVEMINDVADQRFVTKKFSAFPVVVQSSSDSISTVSSQGSVDEEDVEQKRLQRQERVREKNARRQIEKSERQREKRELKLMQQEEQLTLSIKLAERQKEKHELKLMQQEEQLTLSIKLAERQKEKHELNLMHQEEVFQRNFEEQAAISINAPELVVVDAPLVSPYESMMTPSVSSEVKTEAQSSDALALSPESSSSISTADEVEAESELSEDLTLSSNASVIDLSSIAHHLAQSNMVKELSALLLHHSELLTARDENNFNLLHTAIYARAYDVLTYLVKLDEKLIFQCLAADNTQATYTYEVHLAAASNDVNTICVLRTAQHCRDMLDLRDSGGYTAFEIAYHLGNLAVLQYLVNNDVQAVLTNQVFLAQGYQAPYQRVGTVSNFYRQEGESGELADNDNINNLGYTSSI